MSKISYMSCLPKQDISLKFPTHLWQKIGQNCMKCVENLALSYIYFPHVQNANFYLIV